MNIEDILNDPEVISAGSTSDTAETVKEKEVGEKDERKSFDLISELPRIIGAVKAFSELSGGMNRQNGNGNESKPAISRPHAHNHSELLLAMKPYLSADKCEKIDSICKISKLLDLLGSLNFGNLNLK